MTNNESNSRERINNDSNTLMNIHGEAYVQKGYSGAEVEILLKLERLEIEVKTLRDSENKYIRREEFEPIQKLVYGLVSIILIGFIGAVFALVVK